MGARLLAVAGEVPCIEVPMVICEHYNRQNLKGFHDVGYFIFNGIKVYAEGTMDKLQPLETDNIENRLFGHSKIQTTGAAVNMGAR